MYKKSFYIKTNIWNNALSFEKRINKKIFVTNLIKWDFNNIKLWNEVVFEDFDFDWKLISAKWLKNFYKFSFKNNSRNYQIPIYLFDNHNHAYFFWYLARNEWIIWDNNILYHIDEHADFRDPWEYVLKPKSYDLTQIFDYTNFYLNVWNYIIPAQKEWIISKVIQIRSEENLLWVDLNNLPENIILNLDLDFFEPNLDYIDFELKKKVILTIAKNAKIITIATSPFFINQELAINIFKKIFFEYI